MFPATKNPTWLVFLCPLPAAYQGAWCCSGAEFQKPGEQEAEVPGERDEAANQGSGKDHTEASGSQLPFYCRMIAVQNRPHAPGLLWL